VLNNLLNWRALQHVPEVYERYGLRKKWWEPISSEDLKDKPGEQPWLDQPDAAGRLEEALQQSSFSEDLKARLRLWPQNGYLVLPGFFRPETLDAAQAELESLRESGQLDAQRSGTKVTDAWHYSPRMEAMMKDPQLLEIMSFLLGAQVHLFQTLNFEYGSQYDAHSDTIHMTTHPLGYLTAVWVAMEDISPESGPLFYYPGSHRLPYILNPDFPHNGSAMTIDPNAVHKFNDYIKQMIEEHGLEAETFLPQKGDLLIWHAILLHGGMPRQQPDRTRRCTVGHYFAEGVICYHEHTQRPAQFAYGSG
jgi:hypothetical protein